MRDSRHIDPAATLAALLRGEQWPEASRCDADCTAYLAAADRHGVAPLLSALLKTERRGCPPSLLTGLIDAGRRAAALETLRHHELLRVLQSLRWAGIQALVLKGAALAYSHYSHPSLRPRSDTDLLVSEHDFRGVSDALQHLGYEARPTRDDEAAGQTCFIRRERIVQHVIDLHWRISDRPLFANAFDTQSMMQRAVPISGLGPDTWTLAPAHALALACLHRVRHNNSDLLIWLIDIRQLVHGLTGEDVAEFVAFGRSRQVCAILTAGVLCATHVVNVRLPESLEPWLTDGAGLADREPTAKYLTMPRWAARLLDVRTQPDATAQWRSLRTLIAPDPRSLVSYYGTTAGWWPTAHVNRIMARIGGSVVQRSRHPNALHYPRKS